MKKRFEQLAATPPTPAKPSSLSLPRSNGGGRPTAGRERALSSDCGRSSGLEEEGGGGAQEAGGGPARPGVVRKRSSSGPPSRMEQPKEVPKDEEQRTLHGWRSQVNLKIAPDLPSSTSKPPFSSSRQSSFASTTKPSPNPAVPKLAVKPSPPPVPPLATRPASVSTSTSSYRKAPAPPTPRKVIAPAIPQEGSDAAQKEVLARPEPLASVGSVKLLAAKLMVRSLPPCEVLVLTLLNAGRISATFQKLHPTSQRSSYRFFARTLPSASPSSNRPPGPRRAEPQRSHEPAPIFRVARHLRRR